MTSLNNPADSLPAARRFPFVPSSNEDLADELTRLAGHINAAEYRFLKLLAALIERGAWGGYGIKSPAHWLNYYCGIGLNAAREKVRVAKCLDSLPLIDEAFSKGEISFSKVRAMTRSATPANESILLTVARHGTAQHVEMLVRKHQRVLRIADSMQDRKRHESREFRWHYDDDGMLVFKGRLPPEEGEAFLKAMEAMMKVMEVMEDKRPKDTRVIKEGDDVTAVTSSDAYVTAETPPVEIAEDTFAQKRADALVLMAEQALDSLRDGPRPLAAADKYQVIVHLHSQHKLTDSSCTLEHEGHHAPLSLATARRLACNASLVPVLEDQEGKVLNIGRKSRAVPPAMRRALHLRDKCCRFPGCCEARYVDAHHVVHWCEGGETRLDNLVLLCRRHHRLLHQEGYRIERDEAGRFVFLRPDDEAMAQALCPQFADAAMDPFSEMLAIEVEHEGLGLEIDACTILPKWGGERLDYNYAIYGLRDMDARASTKDA